MTPRRRHLALSVSTTLLACMAACDPFAAAPADAVVADAADAAPDVTADADPADTSASTEAITAPAKTWTWVDFPGAFCDDGSTTGIGVNLNPASDNVLVFMQGGGACWEYGACLILNTAAHGPFKAPQLEGAKGNFPDHFDRDDASNPFRDWSYVFVPYCTGDLHAGNKVNVYYDLFNAPHDYHHVGHQNVLAYLPRLHATFPAIDRFVLSGASAGGFGAVFNYDAFRTQLAPAEGALIDDSGPPFIGNAISYTIRGTWNAAWAPQATVAPFCGDACLDDLSLMIEKLAQRYPADRLSLLSSLQDQTIRLYFGQSPADFEAALRALVTTRIAPTANVRAFVVGGDTHTMLASVPSFPGLAAFIDAQLFGVGWTTVIPAP